MRTAAAAVVHMQIRGTLPIALRNHQGNTSRSPLIELVDLNEDSTQLPDGEMTDQLAVMLAGEVAERMLTGRNTLSINNGSNAQRAAQLALMLVQQRDGIGGGGGRGRGEQSGPIDPWQIEGIRTLLAQARERARSILESERHAFAALMSAVRSSALTDQDAIKAIVEAKWKDDKVREELLRAHTDENPCEAFMTNPDDFTFMDRSQTRPIGFRAEMNRKP
jgi:hypothetical protein